MNKFKLFITKRLKSRNDELLSSLHLAVAAKDIAKVRKLLKRNPELNCNKGGDILHLAVVSHQVEIASMFVLAGAKINLKRPFGRFSRRFNLLHEVVCSYDTSYQKLAVLIMENGANVNGHDDDGLTPLRRAIVAKVPIDMIRKLLKYGAHVYCEDVKYASEHPNVVELMVLLVGVYGHRRNELIDNALLHCANEEGNQESEILRELGLLLDMKLHVGEMANARRTLMAAIRTKKIEVVKILIEYGFEVNASIPRYEPFGPKEYHIHAACQSRSKEIIQVLLRHGADIQMTDSEGQTPFSRMVSTGFISPAHELVINHIALLISRGKSIRDGDLRIIGSHPEMRFYYTECLDELEKMKLMKISKNISFFSIYENPGEIAFLSRNTNFVNSYNRVRRKDKFPIYHEEINFVFEKIIVRNELSEKEKALCESLENILPHIPLERIIYYLYLNDVK